MIGVDIDGVLNVLSQKIGELTKENAILNVLVNQLKDALQSANETQVKKQGVGVSAQETAGTEAPI